MPTIPEDGDHLARYCDAQKKGALTRRQVAAVIGRLDVIARWVIVRPCHRWPVT